MLARFARKALTMHHEAAEHKLRHSVASLASARIMSDPRMPPLMAEMPGLARAWDALLGLHSRNPP